MKALDVIVKLRISDLLSRINITVDFDTTVNVEAVLYCEQAFNSPDFVTINSDDLFNGTDFEYYRTAFEAWAVIEAEHITIITDTCN